MTSRISFRPPVSPAIYPKAAKGYSTAGARRAGRGYSTDDSLERAQQRTAWGKRQPAATLSPSQKAQARAKRRAETAANHGYRGAFVMLDLTHTEAHARRQAAIGHIWDDHDVLERQGQGFLHIGEKVDAKESHISVVRGIRSAMLHPDDVAAGKEAPAPGHLDAFDAVGKLPAAKLALADHITYWAGPAFGPPKYLVAAIEVTDASDALGRMRDAWSGAKGTFVPPTKDVPMHLTLAYLRLDAGKLPPSTEARVLAALRDGAGKPMAWLQTDVYYSGRYGAEFARAKLPNG